MSVIRLKLVVQLLLLTITFTSAGCVRRRMTIRSNPPAAMVYIDDQEIGTTPVSTSFLYYGTRKIQLVKDGFETITTLHTIDLPWYQFPPLDFVTENVISREIRDERVLDFQLQPQRIVPKQELLSRAHNLRQNTLQGFIAPTPTVPRVVTPSPAPPPSVLPLPPVAPPP